MSLCKLFKNPIIHILLKNDVTVYGEFVRELLYTDCSFDKYINNSNKRITSYGKEVFRDIIERDLNKYIVKVYDNLKKTNYKSNIISYALVFNKKKFFLDIIYVKNSVEFYLKFYLSDLNISLDIDSLYVNRETHGCLDIPKLYKIEPVPLYKILNNIKNKQYKIITSVKKLYTNQLKNILNLSKKGWKNIDNSLLYCKNMNDSKKNAIYKEQCAICTENHNNTTIELPCKHYFHNSCFIDYIKNIVDNNDNDLQLEIKCPYCTQELYISEII